MKKMVSFWVSFLVVPFKFFANNVPFSIKTVLDISILNSSYIQNKSNCDFLKPYLSVLSMESDLLNGITEEQKQRLKQYHYHFWVILVFGIELTYVQYKNLVYGTACIYLLKRHVSGKKL